MGKMCKHRSVKNQRDVKITIGYFKHKNFMDLGLGLHTLVVISSMSIP